MLDKKEEPIFIIGNVHENTYHKYNIDFLKKIDDLNTPYKVILFSNLHSFKNKPFIKYNPEKLKSNFDLTQFIMETYLCQE